MHPITKLLWVYYMSFEGIKFFKTEVRDFLKIVNHRQIELYTRKEVRNYVEGNRLQRDIRNEKTKGGWR